MLEVLKPAAIICYGEAFPEMRGNILLILRIAPKKSKND
jgi:hypothetical protein